MPRNAHPRSHINTKITRTCEPPTSKLISPQNSSPSFMNDNNPNERQQLLIPILVAAIGAIGVIIAAWINRPQQDPQDQVRRHIIDRFGNSNLNLLAPVAPPPNFSCPSIPGAGWLQSPGLWYGPYRDRYGYMNFISFDATNVYVANSNFGIRSYPDPGSFGRRSQWLPLNTAPFGICVDQLGRVFAHFYG